MYGTRKRKRPNYALPFTPPRRVVRTKRARTYRRGYDRRVGYYGRFVGPGSRELKFFDKTNNINPVGPTGNIYSTLNNVAIGTGESDRIGRKIIIKAIHVRFDVSLDSQSAPVSLPEGETLRVILYVDKQTNGAAAAVADILETAHVRSYKNLVNTGRFRIMYDKYININYLTLNNNDDSAGVKRHYAINKRCNIPIEFSGTTGTVSEMATNNIGMLLISQTGQVNWNSHSRIRYSDS